MDLSLNKCRRVMHYTPSWHVILPSAEKSVLVSCYQPHSRSLDLILFCLLRYPNYSKEPTNKWILFSFISNFITLKDLDEFVFTTSWTTWGFQMVGVQEWRFVSSCSDCFTCIPIKRTQSSMVPIFVFVLPAHIRSWCHPCSLSIGFECRKKLIWSTYI